MSRDVVTLVFSLSPNAKEIKNKITDGISTAIPRCWSDKCKNPNLSCATIVSAVSIKSIANAAIANNSESFFFLRSYDLCIKIFMERYKTSGNKVTSHR